MKRNTKQTLDMLVTDLGGEGAVAYVRFVIPHLVERRDTLLMFLAQQDWESAAQLAHKSMSTVRIYDDNMLEPLLVKIEQKMIEKISQPSFQQEFQQTFDDLLAAIGEWLQRHG